MKAFKHEKILSIFNINYLYFFISETLKCDYQKKNYPAYTLDDTNRIVLEDNAGNAMMLSHTFDPTWIGKPYKEMA